MDDQVIGVDTGNRCIKTRSNVFTAGIRQFDREPPVRQDMILYNGRYYVLSTQRNAYLQDKTEDEMYFVLALFAIVKELKSRGISLQKNSPVPIHLGVGLPPSDVSRLKERFIQYFARDTVKFQYNGQPVSVKILDVRLLAQGYAAIASLPDAARKAAHAYIVDIGGYTTDVMSIRKGILDPKFCESLNFGMIQMYNAIIAAVQSQTGRTLEEDMIDDILRDPQNAGYAETITAVVLQAADRYTENFIRKLTELGIDLTINKGVFVGGGSLNLRERIAKSPDVSDPLFCDNISANAVGYEVFIQSYLKRKQG